MPEEVVKSEFDDSKVVKKDWGFTLREVIFPCFVTLFNEFECLVVLVVVCTRSG